MTEVPHLLMPPDKAERLLHIQIRRGEAIGSGDMSDETVERSLSQMDAWEAETRLLLLSMFDSAELADRFTQSGTYPNKRGTLVEKLTALGRVTYKNYCLSDIIKELHLYTDKIAEPEIPPRSANAPSLPMLYTKSKAEADGLLSEQIKEGRLIQNITDQARATQQFGKWNRNTLQLVVDLTDSNRWAKEYQLISNADDVPSKQIDDKIEWLKTLQRRIKYNFPDSSGPDVSTLDTLNRISSRFHSVTRQLQRRYNSRGTLRITDEHDVQDLIHSLLKIFFDDIRPEDYVPSYAGASSRVDFLLKKEQVVLEAKMTRDKLRDKEVGEELLIDIGRYQSHQDCKMLYCFVYDPEGLIRNPSGLENDLSKTYNGLPVKVVIAPHH